MSYEVLARKWRPQTFDEVVGQEHITRTLKKAVESARLSHAYLFSGPRGCGKTSTARILAKVINCTAINNGNPCNVCDSCTGVMQGNNLDVMEIDGASHTGIAEVRDLQESIGYAPSRFASKIYIIDEVHMLSAHAFNALLKTLEEPPRHVYFIFATTAPQKIPDTIKSRCQRHQFKRLEVAEITSQLQKICDSEKVEYDDEALRLLAGKAEGSMRDAESLLDQCITASSGKVVAATVRDTLGMLDQELVLDFLRTIAAGDATAVLKRLDAAVHEGVDLEELLGALVEGFRDLMLIASPGDLSELIFRSSDEIEQMRAVGADYELQDLVTVVERLCNLAPQLKTAGDPRILMESTLVDLSLLDRQTDIRELIERLEDSGAGASGGRAGASRKRPTPTRDKPQSAPAQERATGGSATTLAADKFVEPPPVTAYPATGAGAQTSSPVRREKTVNAVGADVDLASLGYDDLRRHWDGFVSFVRRKRVALGVCLISGTIQSLEGGTIKIRFSKGFSYQRDQVEDATNKKFLKRMIKKYFGKELELVCIEEGSPDKTVAKRRKAAAPPLPKDDSRAEIEAKPMVKKILADFDGEIVRFNRP